MNKQWRPRLIAALQIPDEGNMDELLKLIRSEGISRLGSTELHAACIDVIEEQGANLSQAALWLLRRLKNSGIPPSYSDYIGLDILRLQDTASMNSSLVARASFRLIYELLAYLLEVQELQEHPKRMILEQRVDELLAKCRNYVFPYTADYAPSGQIIKFSLVPESSIPDELIFLRIVQSTELVLATALDLTTQALKLITYGDAVEALVNLHWVACLESLLLSLLRLLSPMSVERWLEFRPFIVQPSAIQSMNFHSLNSQLSELSRILNHPRYPKWQHRYLSYCNELLDQTSGTLERWYKAHTKIAAKYGRAGPEYKPEGVRWLESQRLLEIQPESPIVKE